MSLDRSGRSPLHYAALDDDAEEATRFLTAAADPNLADDLGLRRCTSPRRRRRSGPQRYYRDHGASVSITDHHGNTHTGQRSSTTEARATFSWFSAHMELIPTTEIALDDPSWSWHA